MTSSRQRRCAIMTGSTSGLETAFRNTWKLITAPRSLLSRDHPAPFRSVRHNPDDMLRRGNKRELL